jgi:hypothetical protein
MNRGWMDTVRRWASCHGLQKYWWFLRAEYSVPFARFCENALSLLPTRLIPKRLRKWTWPPDPHAGPEAGWVEQLDKDFRAEWALRFERLHLPADLWGPHFVRDFLRDFAQNPLAGDEGLLLWFINHAIPKRGAGEHCCGLVCILRSRRLERLQPAPAPIYDEAECLVWLRGPYRALGIGTFAIREILQQIEAEACFFDPAKPLRRLTVCYPLRKGGTGTAMELERWTSFFFDQGFRRIRQADTGTGANFVILKRELNW